MEQLKGSFVLRSKTATVANETWFNPDDLRAGAHCAQWDVSRSRYIKTIHLIFLPESAPVASAITSHIHTELP